jgi:hypothetical protein
LIAKVGSWTLKETVLIFMRDGEGSSFSAQSGDGLQNQALTLVCFAIRKSDINNENGQLMLWIGLGDIFQLIEDRAKATPTFEIYLYPDSGSGRSGVKVLGTYEMGRLRFQPANNVLAALAQAQNSIGVKISGFPMLTFPAQGTSEAFTFLMEYCKKGGNL